MQNFSPRKIKDKERKKKREKTNSLGPLLILHHLRIEHIHRIPIAHNRSREQVRVAQNALFAHVLVTHEEPRVDQRGRRASERMTREPDVDGLRVGEIVRFAEVLGERLDAEGDRVVWPNVSELGHVFGVDSFPVAKGGKRAHAREYGKG